MIRCCLMERCRHCKRWRQQQFIIWMEYKSENLRFSLWWERKRFPIYSWLKSSDESLMPLVVRSKPFCFGWITLSGISIAIIKSLFNLLNCASVDFFLHQQLILRAVVILYRSFQLNEIERWSQGRWESEYMQLMINPSRAHHTCDAVRFAMWKYKVILLLQVMP